MILSKKRITKALIRLRGCAGWSAPVLFATPDYRFSRDEAQKIRLIKSFHIGLGTGLRSAVLAQGQIAIILGTLVYIKVYYARNCGINTMTLLVESSMRYWNVFLEEK